MDERIVVADFWNNTDMEKTKYLDERLSPSATISATLQKKIFRVITDAQPRASYRSLF